MRTLALVALVVVAVGAWWHGYRTGILAERSHVRGTLDEQRQASVVMQAELAERLAVLQSERDRANATLAALRESLESTLRLSAEEAAELEIYRRIAGSEGERGLRVDDVALDSNDPQRLSIRLIQIRGRGRVSGTLGVTLHGRDSRGSFERPLISADAADAPAFDLRFFQTVQVRLPKRLDDSIESIAITVEPRQRPHKSQTAVFRRDEIAAYRP